MKIDTAVPGDIFYVAMNMRERDKAEFKAVLAGKYVDVAVAVAARHAERKDAICATHKGLPAAIGIVAENRPHVVTLGFFATDAFPKIAARLTRFIRQQLFPRLKAAGVHRIECASIDGYVEAHRWLEALGLKLEATHPGYGRDGQAFHTFAWVRDDVRKAGRPQ